MEPVSFSALQTPPFLELSSNLFFPGTGNSSINTGPLTRPGAGGSEEKPLALVVDDVPDVTEMISLFLRHAGFSVVTAQSAAAALELAGAQPFDVIISDIGMPGMNGYQLAEALREIPEYRQVPMIAVTGYSMYDDRERALQSGFNAHLVKPIDPSALLDLIRELRD
ncbi:MAG: response regulator [Pyrinomonadaceae bacterium]